MNGDVIFWFLKEQLNYFQEVSSQKRMIQNVFWSTIPIMNLSKIKSRMLNDYNNINDILNL